MKTLTSRIELKQMQEISSILSMLQVTTIFQFRIFSTGSVLILSNLSEIYHLFENGIGDYFTELVKNSRHHAIRIHLWPPQASDHVLNQLQEIDICHGISISYALDNYIDVFSFATNKQHDHIRNHYLNYLPLLKRFIIYFRLKSKKILAQKIEKERFLDNRFSLSGSHLKPHFDLNHFKKKLTSSYIEAILHNKMNKKIKLSRKEVVYLSHLLSGKSIKEVAAEYAISRKTVGLCLKKLMLKTDCYTKDQLMSSFNQALLLIDVL